MMRVLDKLLKNRLDFPKEREATQEFIEDLWKKLGPLQMYKLDSQCLENSETLLSLMPEVELECEVKPLKQEKYKL